MRLRKLAPKDAPYMLEWMRDAEINRFFRFDTTAATEASALDFIAAAQDTEQDLHLACVDQDDVYLGTVSLKHIDAQKQEAEFATSFRACSHGTGAAAFAAREALRIAFEEHDLRRVYLNVLQENARAEAFYKKLGFRLTHQSTVRFERDQSTHTLLWYEITREEAI